MTADWDAGQARRLYSIAQWADGYFDVGAGGRLEVTGTGAAVALTRVVEAAREQGLALPLLLRFPHILRHRVDRLCRAFQAAMAADGYRGGYTAVYPVKVNQQRRVVEVIARHGGARVGLEAGSKPELMAVLAAAGADNTVVVCNGYKDRAYVRLALLGGQLGHRVYVVIEKLSELDLVLAESRRLGLAPLLGVRIRLASIGAGKWQNTGGEKSKFGLSAAEVIRLVARLGEAGLADRLQLLHVHLGSQVPNIRDFQNALGELGRYYCALRRAGLPVDTVDVGGGLGVDYEGTRSRSFCSMNYTVEEYAHNVVHALAELCRAEALPHPHLVTEAGRAMTAHHAVLVTDVIEVERAPDGQPPPAGDGPTVLQDLERVLAGLDGRALLESYHDAAHALAEAHGQFVHGLLDLHQRARAEHLYLAICRAIRPRLRPDLRAHREVLDELEERLADKYFCNLSIFQSLPDVWAINQIFPIVPLQRLDEPPTRRAVLKDLTCDSDGRIDEYVGADGLHRSLPLHPLRPGEPYLLGVFLVGAYQEILGDMHNLFGDTNAVNVELRDGGFVLLEPQQGDSVASVLRYVHFDPTALRAAYARKIAERGLAGAPARALLAELDAGLEGYTYLQSGAAQ